MNTFSPGQMVMMHSPHTGDDVAVNYRGPLPDGNACVVMGGSQMTVPESWLHKVTAFPPVEHAPEDVAVSYCHQCRPDNCNGAKPYELREVHARVAYVGQRGGRDCWAGVVTDGSYPGMDADGESVLDVMTHLQFVLTARAIADFGKGAFGPASGGHYYRAGNPKGWDTVDV